MPYVCNECGKSFRYKVTQRTHKCFGKSDEATPNPKPLTNPLAEENASSFEEKTHPLDHSMTSLLTHNVAYSTRPSFRPKTNNQPIQKFLSHAVS